MAFKMAADSHILWKFHSNGLNDSWDTVLNPYIRYIQKSLKHA